MKHEGAEEEPKEAEGEPKGAWGSNRRAWGSNGRKAGGEQIYDGAGEGCVSSRSRVGPKFGERYMYVCIQ